MRSRHAGRTRVGTALGVLAMCCVVLPVSSAFAGENPLAYRPLRSPDAAPAQAGASPASVLLEPIAFYARVLSRVDGNRCPSHPTCSYYARQAIGRHGAVIGLWMTVDRLIRERTELDSGARIRLPDGRLRIHDPLDHNDFWLSRSRN